MTAITLDTAGNKSTPSSATTVTIDGTAPSGVVTNPTAGSIVTGTVPITSTGSDSVGMWKVEFQVDGVLKGVDASSPYSYAWNSASVANGPHTLTAVIYDAAGNTTASSVGITVQNGTAATAPGAPTLNTPTAGNANVALSWSAPSSDGGAAISGYKVYRGTSSGGETLLTSLGVVTSFTDSTAANGTTYYYQVTAVNSVGESIRSTERSATPQLPLTVPGAPTLNSASWGNASVTGLERPDLERRLRADRLLDLPRHLLGRRSPDRHRQQPRHRLHRRRTHQRRHLLLPGHRQQPDRRKFHAPARRVPPR